MALLSATTWLNMASLPPYIAVICIVTPQNSRVWASCLTLDLPVNATSFSAWLCYRQKNNLKSKEMHSQLSQITAKKVWFKSTGHPGCFCVAFAGSPCAWLLSGSSGFLPQSEHMHVRLTADLKLRIGVNASVNVVCWPCDRLGTCPGVYPASHPVAPEWPWIRKVEENQWTGVSSGVFCTHFLQQSSSSDECPRVR